MKKVNLLSRAEMKKVMGGVESGGGSGSVTCRFKYKYESEPNGPWSNWTGWDTRAFGTCEGWCNDFIGVTNIAHCGFDTLNGAE